MRDPSGFLLKCTSIVNPNKGRRKYRVGGLGLTGRVGRLVRNIGAALHAASR
jgi:hypothetical protein